MMKLALAAALLLVVSSGAFAQAPENPPQPIPEAIQPKPPASPETTQPVTPAPEASKPMTLVAKGVELATVVPGDSFSVTEYYKQNVYDPSDNTIGEVNDVLLDQDGHVTAVILSVGGFLGLGAKYVSVPIECRASLRALLGTDDRNRIEFSDEFDGDGAALRKVPMALITIRTHDIEKRLLIGG